MTVALVAVAYLIAAAFVNAVAAILDDWGGE